MAKVNEPKKREFSHYGAGYKLLNFDNVIEAYNYVDYLKEHGSEDFKSNVRSVSSDNWINNNLDWYGDYKSAEEIKGRVYEVKEKKLLFDLVDQFKSKIATLPSTSFILQRRLQFTSMPTGAFSFARASNSMYQRPGYYDLEAKTFRPASEVEPTGQDQYRHIPTDNPVEIRGLVDQQGRKKVASRTRKVYSKIGQTKRPTAALDLIINNSIPGSLTPKEILYNAIAAILLADVLERGNVRVRIRGMYGTHSGRDLYATLITAKDWKEKLDVNNIGLLLGEGAFVRLKGFSFKYAALTSFGTYIMGLPTAGSHQVYKEAFLANKVFETPAGSKEAFAMLVGGITSESQVMQFVERAITQAEQVVSKHKTE